jgi:hypothetical protein
MRRGLACTLALGLALGASGIAACGDDDGGGSASSTTTASTAPTSSAPGNGSGDDLTSQVDQFCAITSELETIFRELSQGSDGGDAPPQPSPEQQARVQELGNQAAQLMMGLQGSVAQMIPSDAARFQQCAMVLGGPQGVPGG